ncbi:MAG: hypothetical protein KGJ55_03335, partial [Gammaproteobacteria bacterium]|nr:hypothetical protein [Gammaproteobacteria bacterium]
VEAVGEPEWPEEIRLAREKEVLGHYLSGHPIESCRALIAAVCSAPTLKEAIQRYCGETDAGRRHRTTVLVGAWLADVRSVGGERPGRLLTLDDRSAQLVCWIDFEQFRAYGDQLGKDRLVFASGELALVRREGRDAEYRLYARQFFDLAQLQQRQAQALLLRLQSGFDAVPAIADQLGVWRDEGGVPVLIDYVNGSAAARLQLPGDWRVRPDATLLAGLRRLLGADAVQLRLRRWQAQPSARAAAEVAGE